MPPLRLPFKITRSGVRPVLIVLLGPRGSGKTYMAGVQWREWKLGTKERTISCGPVPVLSKQLNLPWHDVPTTDTDAQEKFFGRIADSDEHLYVLIDEFDGYCTAHGYKSPGLYKLINEGRNFGKGVTAIARGSSDISKNVIANADCVCWFRTTEPNLLDYIQRYMKDFPGGEHEARDCIMNLGEHQCLLYLPNSQENKYPGVMKAVEGSLRLWPLPTTETDGDTVDAGSPDAASPSDAPDGPGSARTTTLPGR